MDWLVLSLLSAFSLASADTISKRYLAAYSASDLTFVRFTMTGLMLAPFLFTQSLPMLPPAFWLWVAGLVPLEILAMLLYMHAIRSYPLSQTLPYLSFTPVFGVVTGFVILEEQISLLGFIGILMIVAGAWVLNIKRPVAENTRFSVLLTPFKTIASETGSRLMLSVAALYSITSVLGKGALQYVPASFFGPFYFCLLGIISIVIFSVTKPRSMNIIWRQPRIHLLLGFAMSIMIVAHFLAIEQVEVAYMIAVKRTSLLFGIIYGAILFKEPGIFKNMSAGLLMVLGIFVITYNRAC